MKYLITDCKNTGDIQAKLKHLFASTIEQMLEAEIDEQLGYEKHSVVGNNSGNSRNGYGTKTIIRTMERVKLLFLMTETVNFSLKSLKNAKLALMKSSKKFSLCAQKGCHNGTLKTVCVRFTAQKFLKV